MSSSSRPYLARALYEWLLDNDSTPYVVVDALQKDVVVPEKYIQNGQIVLNISPTAVRNLDISNEMLRFDARFDGNPMEVWVPIQALIAIYSQEHGIGMVFGQEPAFPAVEEKESYFTDHSNGSLEQSTVKNSTTTDKKNHKKATLRIIK